MVEDRTAEPECARRILEDRLERLPVQRMPGLDRSLRDLRKRRIEIHRVHQGVGNSARGTNPRHPRDHRHPNASLCKHPLPTTQRQVAGTGIAAVIRHQYYQRVFSDVIGRFPVPVRIAKHRQ